MSLKEDSPMVRVQTSYQQLSAAASKLNTISDQLGKVVSRLDSSFQKLNVGVSGWVKFSEGGSDDGLHFWFSEVGYAKVGGKWGLAIRSADGRDGADDYSSYEEWLFNDAPRALRIDAVDKIPELFDKLATEVVAATQSVEKKLKQLEEFASAVGAVPQDSLQEITKGNVPDLMRGEAVVANMFNPDKNDRLAKLATSASADLDKTNPLAKLMMGDVADLTKGKALVANLFNSGKSGKGR